MSIGTLPQTLKVGGRDWRIRTDFRDILKIFEAMNDRELEHEEKIYTMLYILYPDLEKMPVRLYQEAAEELGSMAGSILKKLWDRERVPVSYSGGLFHAEEFVLPFLKRAVEEQNGYLLSPMFSPVEGAALMAVNSVAGTKIHRVIENWMSEKRK